MRIGSTPGPWPQPAGQTQSLGAPAVGSSGAGVRQRQAPLSPRHPHQPAAAGRSWHRTRPQHARGGPGVAAACNCSSSCAGTVTAARRRLLASRLPGLTAAWQGLHGGCGQGWQGWHGCSIGAHQCSTHMQPQICVPASPLVLHSGPACCAASCTAVRKPGQEKSSSVVSRSPVWGQGALAQTLVWQLPLSLQVCTCRPG